MVQQSTFDMKFKVVKLLDNKKKLTSPDFILAPIFSKLEAITLKGI